MSHSEKRRHPRVDLELPIFIRPNRQAAPVKATILNLSVSGLMIRTDHPILRVGSHVEIQFEADGALVLRGKVTQRDSVELLLLEEEPEESVIRWADDSGKFGVEFVNLSPEKEHQLGELIRNLLDKKGL